MILTGLILGVLFRSLAGFMTRVMDPNAFAVVQGLSAASLTRIDPAVLPWAGAITAASGIAALVLAALDADRTLATSESMLAASDAQLAMDQVQLFLALGGGWENTHQAHGEGHEGKHEAKEEHVAQAGHEK